METGKQSQTVQRFLRRAMKVAIDEGSQVTRIELQHGNKVILPIKVGDYSKPAMVDELVSDIMGAAKDDAEFLAEGAQTHYTVKAFFGSSPDGGMSTRFPIYKPVDVEHGDDGQGDYPSTPQGALGVGLKFIHGMSKDFMHANNQQHLRLLAQIDRLEESIQGYLTRIKQYEQMEYEHERQRQANLNQEAERKRLDAESERRDAMTQQLLEGAQVAIGAFLPMLASGGTRQMGAAPGVKAAVDWSIKNFAKSITKPQIDNIKVIMDENYDGTPVDPDEQVPGDGPRRFLFMCAMFAAGQAPPPPEEHSKRFFDWLIEKSEKTAAILNCLNMPQRIFLQAHIKARADEVNAEAAAE